MDFTDHLTYAMAPGGTTIVGNSQIAVNFAGADCVFDGWVLVAP